jgi:hypothetical protein
MKKNSGIKLLSAVVVSVVALILINRNHHELMPASHHSNPNNMNAAIASQFNDNIRDVSARLLETQQKIEDLEKQNQALRVQYAARNTEKQDSSLTHAIEQIKQELSGLKDARESTNYPVESSPHGANHVHDIDALLMKHTLSLQEQAYWDNLNKHHPDIKKTTLEQHKPKKDMPYYTIPAGADLSNTTLLSALIGEVPNDGKLMQPLFPFTALISRGDLMASNGIALPSEISGMKVNGYAIGVGSFLDNISCVRAYVTSILFTFQDGHFVTIGNEEMKNTTDLVNNESLGYLTTSFGNPCIHGKYFTNAPRVLAAMMAAGGVQGLGSALSEWQMTSTHHDTGITQSPTGSFARFMTGGAVSEGSVKVADWLEKRIQGSFDMVFVPASVKANGRYRANHVSLHLTKTINLDKQLNGRRLDYGQQQTHIHDTSLS